MVAVELAAGAVAEPTRSGVKVTGTLVLNRTDPERFPFAVTGATVGEVD